MEILLNIGLVSYALASASFFILATLLLFSWRARPFATLMISAVTLTAIWAASSANETVFSNPSWDRGSGILEFVKNTLWCILLSKLLTSGTRIPSFWMFAALAAFSIAAFITWMPHTITKELISAATARNMRFMVSVAYAIVGLLLVEQIYRRYDQESRWAIKYLCLGLGCIFVYDFFLYTEALLFNQIDIDLWNARGFINAIAVPLIAVSIARNPTWEMGIHVSRDVVFHSITVIGTGVYLLAMAAVGYTLRYYGGAWGSTFQIVFFAGSLALLASLLFSDSIRARVRVLLSKHFFSFKYNYREEWLHFTRTLAISGANVPERILRAIAGLVNSERGILLGKNSALSYELLASWNMGPADRIGNCWDNLQHLNLFTEKNSWIIDIDEFRENPSLYKDLQLPDNLSQMEHAWLIVPLTFDEQIYGYVVIGHSNLQQKLNWEDRDLLKTAGLQAASLLAQYQADQSLMQRRQFDAFNRLSAYIVHDLKNILAQQSLIVANAEKHKHKPAFVDDVIATVENSVIRMTRLMEQMRSGLRGVQAVEIDLNELLSKAVEARAKQQPIPELLLGERMGSVYADKDQLLTVFSHIIQNAQEATGANGRVTVSSYQDREDLINVEITDDGCGMDTDFVRNRLFEPFESTKGLTGMGIGVYESRETLRSLGGDIRVESSLGKGSRFYLSIPCIQTSIP